MEKSEGDRKGPHSTQLRPRLYNDDESGSPGKFIVKAGVDVGEGGDPCGRLRASDVLEHDLAQRWHALPLTQSLPLINGEVCSLHYAGRSGGPQGPDIRDAVIQFAPGHASTGGRVTGDVEFHIRCSDWYTHGHHTDPRYNNVILHVVLIFDSIGPVLRHDRRVVPVCSLNDLVPAIFAQPLWPCQCILPSMPHETRSALLQYTGMLRFEQKTQHLLAQLQVSQPRAPFSAYDVCLIPALVEAMGYGRDRAFFRAIGQRLVGLPGDLPEPAGRAPEPSPLDAARLRASGKLVEQWRSRGAWETIRNIIINVDDQPGRGQAPALVDRLHSIFSDLGSARADILICNVVLPFAAAVAHIEHDQTLLEQVQELYKTYPQLTSNSVTRSMYRQLGLEREPKNACQQQGLHYIYAQTCREKQCADCIIVRRDA